MKKYILDANLFFNMEAGLSMGKKTEEVIRSATNYARQLSTAKKAEFYMPPRVVDEVLSFFEDKGQSFLKEFFSSIVTRSPNYGNLTLPSQAFLIWSTMFEPEITGVRRLPKRKSSRPENR